MSENEREEETKSVTIRLTDSEIEAVKRIVRVDAVAPCVVAIVRQRIEDEGSRKAVEE